MKLLSEAIRAGSATTRKCTEMFIRPGNDEVIAACALGAAIVDLIGEYEARMFSYCPRSAETIIEEGTGVNIIGDLLPLPDSVVIPDSDPKNVLDVLAYLNDEVGWERERIADYLAEQGL